MESVNWISLLFFLLSGGGGSDLLDYVPTDVYWASQDVRPTAAVLLADIKPDAPAGDLADPIDDLGSPDAAAREAAAERIRAAGLAALPQLRKEADSEDLEVARRVKALVTQILTDAKPRSVRRLMAVRTLGEQKAAAALPALRQLTASAEPFVADYARRAVMRIEGKPGTGGRRPDPKAMAGDVWLMPKEVAAVGQVALRPGLAPDFATALGDMKLSPEKQKQRLTHVSEQIVELTRRIGNVRLDGVTFGVSADAGETSGFVALVVRGLYDAPAAAAAARQDGLSAKPVGGVEVFQVGPEVAFFFPSNDLAVFVAAPTGREIPVEPLVSAVRAGKGTLHESKDVAGLVKAADTTLPLWAVAKVTDAYRRVPFLSAFDTLTITGRQEKARLDLSVTAKGSDPTRTKAAVADVNRLADEAHQQLKPIAEFMPPLKPLSDFLDSVKADASGTDATVAAAFEGSVTKLFLFSLMPYTEPITPPANDEVPLEREEDEDEDEDEGRAPVVPEGR